MRGGVDETLGLEFVGGNIVKTVCRTEWCCKPAQPSVCRTLLQLWGGGPSESVLRGLQEERLTEHPGMMLPVPQLLGQPRI